MTGNRARSSEERTREKKNILNEMKNLNISDGDDEDEDSDNKEEAPSNEHKYKGDYNCGNQSELDL